MYIIRYLVVYIFMLLALSKASVRSVFSRIPSPYLLLTHFRSIEYHTLEKLFCHAPSRGPAEYVYKMRSLVLVKSIISGVLVVDYSI